MTNLNPSFTQMFELKISYSFRSPTQQNYSRHSTLQNSFFQCSRSATTRGKFPQQRDSGETSQRAISTSATQLTDQIKQKVEVEVELNVVILSIVLSRHF